MAARRFSRLAIASVIPNLPWMIALAWCFWVTWITPGPVAGEIFLIPFILWGLTGIVAGICGRIAWTDIRASAGTLRGLWLAGIGMFLSTIVPGLGVAENIYGTMRAARINRDMPRESREGPLRS